MDFWRLYLVTFVCIIHQQDFVTGYSLTPPQNYTVFSGDINVDYSVPAGIQLNNALVQLVYTRGGSNIVITSTRMPSGYNEGTLMFDCGVVDRAGTYLFRMIREEGGPVLKQAPAMNAYWPKFRMRLPSTHQALTSEVSLQFSTGSGSTRLCSPINQDAVFSIDLIYYGRNNNTNANADKAKNVITSQPVEAFTNQEQTYIFPCHLFDQAGMFEIHLTTSYQPGMPLATSNPMQTTWSNRYSLDALGRQNIFPGCNQYITIAYKHAQCSGDQDKVRLYKQIHISSSPASPRNLNYIGEQRATKTGSSVHFDCNLFHEENPAYCFKYVSTARNGAVNEQATLCLPTTDKQAIVVNGGWSEWSDWSACSASCGEGRQYRDRDCTDPKPSPGGAYCEGSEIQQVRACVTDCHGTLGSTPGPGDLLSPDELYKCGGTMVQDSGKVIATTRATCGAGGSGGGSLTWKIKVPEGKVVHLHFQVFSMDLTNKGTWVQVRDGSSHMSDLLLFEGGGPIPPDVTTTGNIMLVEFESPVTPTPDLVGPPEGFVAVFSAQEPDGGILLGPGGGSKSRQWTGTVTLIGVALCIVLVACTVAFVCHHRITHRKDKAKQLAANQALLVNGEAPNSPSHSSSINSNHGSNNLVFAESGGGGTVGGGSLSPTGSPTRRDYVLAKGLNSQPHNMEKTKQQLQKKGSAEGRRLSSPAHSNSQSSVSHKGVTTPPHAHNHPGAQQVPSPYGVNAQSGDFVHHQGEFAPTNPVDLDPRYRRNKNKNDPSRKHHRRSHGDKKRHSKSPSSPPGVVTGKERSKSPGALSTASSSSARNPSFKKAISNKGPSGVPLADEEDLSPVSPVSPATPTREQIGFAPRTNSTTPGGGGGGGRPGEVIPMGDYYDRRNNRNRFRDSGIADTHIGSPDSYPRQTMNGPGTGVHSEPRPPVEGRDSLRRGKDYPYSGVTTPDRQNGNFISGQGHPQGQGHKPGLKPLPLRNVQRPDGQSPEHPTEDPNANSGNNTGPARYPSTPDSNDLSPVLRKTQLFGDIDSKASSAVHTPDNQDFEYDDFVPEFPGSYFAMDPGAYTLTWSNNKQPTSKTAAPSSGGAGDYRNESNA